MNVIRRIHLFVAWAFVAALVVQVFLAGLGVFESASKFEAHAGWGFTIGLIPLVLLVLAGAGQLGQRQVLYAAALFGLFIVQSILVAMRSSAPVVAALHPVNGFLILFVAVSMAREAWAARAQPVAKAEQAEPSAAEA
jgi:hypothetical protein